MAPPPKRKPLKLSEPPKPPAYEGELVWIQIPKRLNDALEERLKAQGTDESMKLSVEQQVAVAIEVCYCKELDNKTWKERIRIAEERYVYYKALEKHLNFLQSKLDPAALKKLDNRLRYYETKKAKLDAIQREIKQRRSNSNS